MRADAFSVQNPIHDETDVDGYGYGWRIHGEKMWHSGETMGFRNVIVRWPQKHFTVIVLTNRNDPEPYRLAMEVAGLYLPESPPQDRQSGGWGKSESARVELGGSPN